VSIAEIALLAGAGFLAGAVNAVAGGGSLISFPALLAVGQPAVTANVTNAVAVVPGYLGGTIGYRRELAGQKPRALRLAASSVVGAVCGAILLLVTSERLFKAVVPFLVLFSTALLAVQPLLSRYARRPAGGEHGVRLHAMNFAAAVYGGYFGAGLGIMLLALLGISIDDELQRLNALKGLLSLVVGLVAATYFALFGPVQWDAAAIMAVTSLGGGQAGVVLARRLDDAVLRWVVVAFGTAVGIALFFT
jgi:uncharacterized membrane protein YfcA